MKHDAQQHTTFNETKEGTWTYTRQEQTSLPFPTLHQAESHENETFEHQGTANYCYITAQGKKQIADQLNPFGDRL